MTTSHNTSLAQDASKKLSENDSKTVSLFAKAMSDAIGLDLNRVGVDSAVRAAHQALDSFKELAFFKEGPSEALKDQMMNNDKCRKLFIESIVVSESWLFREPKVFQHINSTI